MDSSPEGFTPQSNHKSKRLWTRVWLGSLSEVEILANDLDINLNMSYASGRTVFHRACKGQASVVAYFLNLKGRDMDYNKPDYDGMTPFALACQERNLEVVEMLLKSELIDIDTIDHNGRSPFWMAVKEGHLDVLELLLVSRRKIDYHRIDEVFHQSALFCAKQLCRDTWSLLEEFFADPENTIELLDEKLNYSEESRNASAGRLFAWVVFLSDEYLALPEN